MKRVLVLCDYFWPGYKAGGPITTMKSTIKGLSSKFSFYVVTRDRDLKAREPYPEIRSGEWNATPYGDVYYAYESAIYPVRIHEIINRVSPDIIYLNSLFSLRFTFFVLLQVVFLVRYRGKILLCPRGELNESALGKGKIKKDFYLFFFRLIGFHSRVDWQATNDRELAQIRSRFGADVKVAKASNLTWGVSSNIDVDCIEKAAGELKLIFVARINNIKNLKFALRSMSELEGKIELTIIGPVDEEKYWEECLQLIETLPKNIEINYLGEIENIKIPYYIRRHHYLCLPTKGENFGQAIYESFSYGRPVIISDQTPWRNLSELKAGWDVDIKDMGRFREALRLALEQNNSDWVSSCESALSIAQDYNEKTIHENIELFAEVC